MMRIRLMGLLRRQDGYAIVISMLLLAIMMVSLVVALEAGQAAFREADFGVRWSKTLAVAEAGVDDAIVTLGDDRTATSACPIDGATACEADGGEYQVEWTPGPEEGTLILTSRGYYPRMEDGAYTRTVEVLMEPVPEFVYALFAADDLVVKNNANVDGSAYSTGAITIGTNATICGSVVSANGSVSIGANSDIVQANAATGCTGEDGDVWVGGSIVGSMGNVIEGDAKASAPTGTACNALSVSYQITTVTVNGDATACGRINASVVLGVQSPGTSTTPSASETLPTFTFNEANYDTIECYGGPGSDAGACAETNTAADAVTRFNTDITALGGTISGTYAVWQDAPTSSDYIDLDPLVVSGDFTLITNAPVNFGNTAMVSSVGGIDAEVVIVSQYEPADATSCGVNGGDCSIYGNNQITFDDGDDADPDDGIVALLYTPGKTAFKNSATPSSFGEGSLYSGSMDFMNGFDITYNARIASILGFGSGLTPTLWQEISD